ncbi:MAG: diacylglycerol kinase family protein [Bacteroidales bacterium]|nr:diacylglycerol kinase family protein [Bacteroidales bacterium]MCF8403979.1 diacylglycerol kinase family protein [Bacteroidales bacterium]
MNNSSSGKFSLKKRMESFKYAFNGIILLSREHNAWIHFVAALLVIILGFIFNISFFEWMVILICIGLVLSLELMNTAIENLTNLVSPGINPKAGRIKDIAAGAVLISAIISAIIGVMIFLPKIWALLSFLD